MKRIIFILILIFICVGHQYWLNAESAGRIRMSSEEFAKTLQTLDYWLDLQEKNTGQSILGENIIKILKDVLPNPEQIYQKKDEKWQLIPSADFLPAADRLFSKYEEYEKVIEAAQVLYLYAKNQVARSSETEKICEPAKIFDGLSLLGRQWARMIIENSRDKDIKNFAIQNQLASQNDAQKIITALDRLIKEYKIKLEEYSPPGNLDEIIRGILKEYKGIDYIKRLNLLSDFTEKWNSEVNRKMNIILNNNQIPNIPNIDKALFEKLQDECKKYADRSTTAFDVEKFADALKGDLYQWTWLLYTAQGKIKDNQGENDLIQLKKDDFDNFIKQLYKKLPSTLTPGKQGEVPGWEQIVPHMLAENPLKQDIYCPRSLESLWPIFQGKLKLGNFENSCNNLSIQTIDTIQQFCHLLTRLTGYCNEISLGTNGQIQWFFRVCPDEFIYTRGSNSIDIRFGLFLAARKSVGDTTIKSQKPVAYLTFKSNFSLPLEELEMDNISQLEKRIREFLERPNGFDIGQPGGSAFLNQLGLPGKLELLKELNNNVVSFSSKSGFLFNIFGKRIAWGHPIETVDQAISFSQAVSPSAFQDWLHQTIVNTWIERFEEFQRKIAKKIPTFEITREDWQEAVKKFVKKFSVNREENGWALEIPLSRFSNGLVAKGFIVVNMNTAGQIDVNVPNLNRENLTRFFQTKYPYLSFQENGTQPGSIFNILLMENGREMKLDRPIPAKIENGQVKIDVEIDRVISLDCGVEIKGNNFKLASDFFKLENFTLTPPAPLAPISSLNFNISFDRDAKKLKFEPDGESDKRMKKWMINQLSQLIGVPGGVIIDKLYIDNDGFHLNFMEEFSNWQKLLGIIDKKWLIESAKPEFIEKIKDLYPASNHLPLDKKLTELLDFLKNPDQLPGALQGSITTPIGQMKYEIVNPNDFIIALDLKAMSNTSCSINYSGKTKKTNTNCIDQWIRNRFLSQAQENFTLTISEKNFDLQTGSFSLQGEVILLNQRKKFSIKLFLDGHLEHNLNDIRLEIIKNLEQKEIEKFKKSMEDTFGEVIKDLDLAAVENQIRSQIESWAAKRGIIIDIENKDFVIKNEYGVPTAAIFTIKYPMPDQEITLNLDNVIFDIKTKKISFERVNLDSLVSEIKKRAEDYFHNTTIQLESMNKTSSEIILKFQANMDLKPLPFPMQARFQIVLSEQAPRFDWDKINIFSQVLNHLREDYGGYSYENAGFSIKISNIEPIGNNSIKITGESSLSKVLPLSINFSLVIKADTIEFQRPDINIIQETIRKLGGNILKSLGFDLGGISIDFTNLSPLGGAIPNGIKVKPKATIFEKIHLEFPQINVTPKGVEFSDPDNMEIGVKIDGESVIIPIAPFILEVNGGKLSKNNLTLSAALSFAQAKDVLTHKGEYTIELTKLSKFTASGELVLFKNIDLGRQEVIVDLAEKKFSIQFDLGGRFADVLNLVGSIQGDLNKNVRIKGKAKAQVFKLDFDKVEFDIDLNKKQLSFTKEDIVIPIGSVNFTFNSGEQLSNPTLRGGTNINVLGYQLAGVEIFANPWYASLDFEVLGIKTGLTVPGIARLNKGLLEELIKKLLYPDWKNLDKALEAVLSGNFEINPFSSFGKGNNAGGEQGKNGPQRGSFMQLGEVAHTFPSPPPGTPSEEAIGKEKEKAKEQNEELKKFDDLHSIQIALREQGNVMPYIIKEENDKLPKALQKIGGNQPEVITYLTPNNGKLFQMKGKEGAAEIWQEIGKIAEYRVGFYLAQLLPGSNELYIHVNMVSPETKLGIFKISPELGKWGLNYENLENIKNDKSKQKLMNHLFASLASSVKEGKEVDKISLLNNQQAVLIKYKSAPQFAITWLKETKNEKGETIYRFSSFSIEDDREDIAFIEKICQYLENEGLNSSIVLNHSNYKLSLSAGHLALWQKKSQWEPIDLGEFVYFDTDLLVTNNDIKNINGLEGLLRDSISEILQENRIKDYKNLYLFKYNDTLALCFKQENSDTVTIFGKGKKASNIENLTPKYQIGSIESFDTILSYSLEFAKNGGFTKRPIIDDFKLPHCLFESLLYYTKECPLCRDMPYDDMSLDSIISFIRNYDRGLLLECLKNEEKRLNSNKFTIWPNNYTVSIQVSINGDIVFNAIDHSVLNSYASSLEQILNRNHVIPVFSKILSKWIVSTFIISSFEDTGVGRGRYRPLFEKERFEVYLSHFEQRVRNLIRDLFKTSPGFGKVLPIYAEINNFSKLRPDPGKAGTQLELADQLLKRAFKETEEKNKTFDLFVVKDCPFVYDRTGKQLQAWEANSLKLKNVMAMEPELATHPLFPKFLDRLAAELPGLSEQHPPILEKLEHANGLAAKFKDENNEPIVFFIKSENNGEVTADIRGTEELGPRKNWQPTLAKLIDAAPSQTFDILKIPAVNNQKNFYFLQAQNELFYWNFPGTYENKDIKSVITPLIQTKPTVLKRFLKDIVESEGFNLTSNTKISKFLPGTVSQGDIDYLFAGVEKNLNLYIIGSGSDKKVRVTSLENIKTEGRVFENSILEPLALLISGKEFQGGEEIILVQIKEDNEWFIHKNKDTLKQGEWYFFSKQEQSFKKLGSLPFIEKMELRNLVLKTCLDKYRETQSDISTGIVNDYKSLTPMAIAIQFTSQKNWQLLGIHKNQDPTATKINVITNHPQEWQDSLADILQLIVNRAPGELFMKTVNKELFWYDVPNKKMYRGNSLLGECNFRESFFFKLWESLAEKGDISGFNVFYDEDKLWIIDLKTTLQQDSPGIVRKWLFFQQYPVIQGPVEINDPKNMLLNYELVKKLLNREKLAPTNEIYLDRIPDLENQTYCFTYFNRKELFVFSDLKAEIIKLGSPGDIPAAMIPRIVKNIVDKVGMENLQNCIETDGVKDKENNRIMLFSIRWGNNREKLCFVSNSNTYSFWLEGYDYNMEPSEQVAANFWKLDTEFWGVVGYLNNHQVNNTIYIYHSDINDSPQSGYLVLFQDGNLSGYTQTGRFASLGSNVQMKNKKNFKRFLKDCQEKLSSSATPPLFSLFMEYSNGSGLEFIAVAFNDDEAKMIYPAINNELKDSFRLEGVKLQPPDEGLLTELIHFGQTHKKIVLWPREIENKKIFFVYPSGDVYVYPEEMKFKKLGTIPGKPADVFEYVVKDLLPTSTRAQYQTITGSKSLEGYPGILLKIEDQPGIRVYSKLDGKPFHFIIENIDIPEFSKLRDIDPIMRLCSPAEDNMIKTVEWISYNQLQGLLFQRNGALYMRNSKEKEFLKWGNGIKNCNWCENNFNLFLVYIDQKIKSKENCVKKFIPLKCNKDCSNIEPVILVQVGDIFHAFFEKDQTDDIEIPVELRQLEPLLLHYLNLSRNNNKEIEYHYYTTKNNINKHFIINKKTESLHYWKDNRLETIIKDVFTPKLFAEINEGNNNIIKSPNEIISDFWENAVDHLFVGGKLLISKKTQKPLLHQNGFALWDKEKRYLYFSIKDRNHRYEDKKEWAPLKKEIENYKSQYIKVDKGESLRDWKAEDFLSEMIRLMILNFVGDEDETPFTNDNFQDFF